jgi:D-threo-aldose 1-dehydrogenase
MPFDTIFDYFYEAIRRSFQVSLQRPGVARIDILFVHDIGAMQHGPDAHLGITRTLRESGYRALEELRGGGLIRAVGIGVNEREVLLEAMEWVLGTLFFSPADTLSLSRAPLDDLLPKCLSLGISIVVGGPLNSGILAVRDTRNHKTASPEVAQVDRIRAVCDSHKVSVAAAASQFPLARQAVAAIIPDPRSTNEFAVNLKLLCHPIPPALWRDLQDAKLIHPLAPMPAESGNE